jgi:hypothetical protein
MYIPNMSIVFFVCGLIFDAASITVCNVGGRMTVRGELEKIWKEVIMT